MGYLGYELEEIFYQLFPNPDEHVDIARFCSVASARLGISVTPAGLEALASAVNMRLSQRNYDFEEMLTRAARLSDEELRTLLEIPSAVFSLRLRGEDTSVFLIAVGERIIRGPMAWVAERIRPTANTIVFAVDGYAPLAGGELEVAPGVTMAVRAHWSRSYHDVYVEAFSVTFTFASPADVNVNRAREYVQMYLPRFVPLFAGSRELAARFDVSRRADPR